MKDILATHKLTHIPSRYYGDIAQRYKCQKCDAYIVVYDDDFGVDYFFYRDNKSQSCKPFCCTEEIMRQALE